MSIAFVIGAVAGASAVLGMGIAYVITRKHYKKYIPRKGLDGKFTTRN